MSVGIEISPSQCWDMLSNKGDALLIDVRSQAEWTFVGIPNLDEQASDLLVQEWQVYPQMLVDDAFAEKLSAKLSSVGGTKDTKLCFLCRSGARSLSAAHAMSAVGYVNTYNVTHGFEGDPDGNSHRGTINGWKAEGLPWRQG